MKYNSTIDIDSSLLILKEKFPELKIRKSGKKTIIVPNGRITTIVRFRKSCVKIHGDLNMKDPLIFMLVAIGVITGAITLIIIFPILWISLSKKIRVFKLDVFNALQ